MFTVIAFDRTGHVIAADECNRRAEAKSVLASILGIAAVHTASIIRDTGEEVMGWIRDRHIGLIRVA